MQKHLQPKVSIMIPTYNQETYIAEAIESALRQDYENLEIVIADDCSTDGTRDVVSHYLSDSRVKYVQNRSNLGRVNNYHNTLYNHTVGEWVINLDGDDYYTDYSFISRAIEAINKTDKNSPDIVAYCSGQSKLSYIKSNYEFIQVDEHTISFNGKKYFTDFYNIGSFFHMGILYNKDAILKIGAYTKLYQASDFHTLMRLFLTGDIILSDYNVGHWRIHKTNTTIKEVEIKYAQSIETFDDLIDFAHQYISKEELIKWKESAKERALYDYMATRVIHVKDLKSIYLLIKNCRLNKNYFLLWYYLLFK